MQKYTRFIVVGKREGDIASYSADIRNDQHTALDYAKMNARMYGSEVFGERPDGDWDKVFTPHG